MESIIHRNSNLAGCCVKWWPTDSEELYHQNLRDPVARQQLEQFGWIDADIEYVHNSHGFRTSNFEEEKSNFITLGCSLTYGTGLPQKETWPERLSNLLCLPVYNLGIPGGSTDTCYRIIKHYAPLLKPKYVILLEPARSRQEIFLQQGPYIHLPTNPDFYGFNSDKWIQEWYNNDTNAMIHSQKNIDAIAHVCAQVGAEFYCYTDNFLLEFNLLENKKNFARDLLHPGTMFQQTLSNRVHQDILNNNRYE